MKVGIATLTQGMNYGQRLQNYAVEQILKSLNIDAETLLLDSSFNLNSKQRAIMFANYVLKRGNWKANLRPLKFDQFNKKYIHFSDTIYPSCNFEKYDYIVCGSDQIWNLSFKFSYDNKNFYFADFVKPEKRVAYSASIGTAYPEKEYKETIISRVKSMKAVSVREQSSEKMLKEHSVKNVISTIDPTLMLSAKDWSRIAVKPDYIKKDEKFIFSYFLGSISDETKAYFDNISKQFGMRIIALQGEIYKPESDYKLFSSSPSEFVWLIKNSKLVLTDSFHGCAFASIFRKPFRWFSRKETSIVNMNCRIESFFSMLSIGDWAIGDINEGSDHILFCNYNDYERSIVKEQNKAIEFLKNALEIKSGSGFELYTPKCFGCGACASVCPKECISMTENKEGFLYPVINADLCINCKKCQNICPLNNLNDISSTAKAFCAQNKNDVEREKSSSGGIFLPLARKIIHRNGVVFGAVFNDGFDVVHMYTETEAELEKFCGSKYVQSNIGDSFITAKKFLDEGRPVLFSGTSCQIAGLKSFLGREYNNLLTIDFICHGVPSPALWRKYLKSFNCGLPEKVSFRDKSTGWKSYSVKIDFEHKNYSEKYFNDPYMQMFLDNLTLRESCYSCPYKMKNIASDITVADFWGIETIEPDDNKGTSLIFINTEKADALIKEIDSEIKIKEVCMSEAIKGNKAAFIPPERHGRREKYLKYVGRKGFDFIYDNCYNSTRLEKGKTKIAQMIKR